MKKNKFCVIGGQYEVKYYGSYPTLIGAKRVANKNKEYWDNWQGIRIPSIYKIEDTKEVIAKGMITVNDGTKIRVPEPWAFPVC